MSVTPTTELGDPENEEERLYLVWVGTSWPPMWSLARRCRVQF